jgi:CRISPR-associated protein Csh2
MDGIWNGTKNLITRSKMGQMPRLLLRVIYKEKNYHIGDLHKKIKSIHEKSDTEIRDISEVKLDLTKLLETLATNKDKIEKIQYEIQNDIVFTINQIEKKASDMEKVLQEMGIPIEHLPLENM